MRYALLNPNWSFDGSIYFGCREPHLPLEYGYARALLERAGHEVLTLDGQLLDLDLGAMRAALSEFRPDFTVITTAPSYLFWRCAPPELRAAQELVGAVRPVAGTLLAVGPHASTTPRATLRKLGVDAVVLGECEEVLPTFAGRARRDWGELDAVAFAEGDEIVVRGRPRGADMAALPALRWPDEAVARHRHHHHRFDVTPAAPGAEVEASRGCPYRCTFCAKQNFRDKFRRRPVETVLEEVDALAAQGVEYIYFIDEIFMPDEALLRGLVERPVKLGVQLRIDLWSREQLDLLGAAGCVSIEAGVESITEAGRRWLDKRCRLSTDELADLLIHAKRRVPFVQANLLDGHQDDPAEVERWRQRLLREGVWANKPVPLFPYPGSPDYVRLWGAPDDEAWERAVDYYLGKYERFSDIQGERLLPLSALELNAPQRAARGCRA